MLTMEQRREISQRIFRETLKSFTPNCPGNRYSSAQIARAKGLARKRALEIIDARSERSDDAHVLEATYGDVDPAEDRD